MKNYYYILGLDLQATQDDIKKSYRKLVLKFHPDKNNGDKFFEERFKEIQNAYEHLTNSQLKEKHDEFLKKYKIIVIVEDVNLVF